MENTTTFGAAMRGVGVTFTEFFNQANFTEMSGWDPVVRTLRSNNLTDTFSGKTGAGLLQRFSDGSAIPSANRYKLFDTSAEHFPYGSRLEVTRQTRLYRDFDAVFDESSDLITSVNATLSRAGAQIFNRAFTAGNGVTNGVYVTQYADGSRLASTSHARADGGTAQSNASSTSIPLTESNLEVGRVALSLQLQDDGTPMMDPGQLYLVVGLNNQKTATIITESNLRSGTGNNDMNIYTGGAVVVMASKWLDTQAGGTNNTHWFLVAPKWAKLAISISKGPDLDVLQDKDTKSFLWDVILDFFVISYDWRGLYASQGNNAAYSS